MRKKRTPTERIPTLAEIKTSTMCSCLSEGEPAAVRRGQWAAAVQLAPEIVLLLVSIFTLRDGGYLGIGGGATALLACSAPLACCRVPRAAAFARLTCANLVATGWCAAQAAILLSRLATVDDWCCALTASSATSSTATITPGGMRAFLAALVALVGGHLGFMQIMKNAQHVQVGII